MLLLSALAGCTQADVPSFQTSQSTPQPAVKSEPDVELAAAGVAITLPSTWKIVDEREPDFAFAQGPGENRPSCTIELRRQGIGDLPKSTRTRSKGDFDFSRGTLRGRMRALPGPSEGSSVVIECVSHRAEQWGAIEAAFESQTRAFMTASTATTSTTNDTSAASSGPIAQLCVSTPAHPTYVCVRRDDGAVYCGVSDGDVLERVAGIEPSDLISCEGAHACSRAASSGALHCWKADAKPQAITQFTAPRDIAGNCIVDADGKVWCRQRADNGLATDTFVELQPFGDPAFALTEVEHVLAGSGTGQGCVLSPAGLRCWERAHELRLPLPDGSQPHTLAAVSPATDLATIGGRVCIAGSGRWTCLDGERRFTLDGCERRPCGCSLHGAAQLSCEHEPSEHGVAMLGRVSDVIASDGACAALRDGTIVCRGQSADKVGDSPRVRELVAGGGVGGLHVLEIAESK